MDLLFQDEHFDKKDFRSEALAKVEYEGCFFKNCDFSATDLSEQVFVDCTFTDSNLSLVTLVRTVFRDVKKAKFSLTQVAGLLDKYNIIIEMTS